MTEDELLIRIDAVLARNADTFERQGKAFEEMTRGFASFMRHQARRDLEFHRIMDGVRQESSNVGAEVRAMRDAIFALLDRLEPQA